MYSARGTSATNLGNGLPSLLARRTLAPHSEDTSIVVCMLAWMATGVLRRGDGRLLLMASLQVREFVGNAAVILNVDSRDCSVRTALLSGHSRQDESFLLVPCREGALC